MTPIRLEGRAAYSAEAAASAAKAGPARPRRSQSRTPTAAVGVFRLALLLSVISVASCSIPADAGQISGGGAATTSPIPASPALTQLANGNGSPLLSNLTQYVNGNVSCSTNALVQSAVDGILATCCSLTNWGAGKSLYLNGGANAKPSATGTNYLNRITAHGATVVTN